MEGYFNLSQGHAQDRAQYTALIRKTLSDKVRGINLGRSIALGPAAGHDVAPFAESVTEFHCIEPAHAFWRTEIAGVKATYHDPSPDGSIALPSASMDSAIAIGVFHHIPNVSAVVAEIARVLKPGGLLLTREPIVSMGDWTKPREGLTVNERGIPDRIFRDIIGNSGLRIVRATYCDFGPLARIAIKAGMRAPYENNLLTRMDLLLSGMLKSRVRYHRAGLMEKFAPASLAIIAEKPRQS